MLNRLILFLTVLLLGSLPAAAPAQAPESGAASGIVSVPLANVREEPEPKARIVTQVLLADEVRILEKRDYRYRISIPGQGGREGWVQQEAVLVPKDKGRAYLKADRQWIVVTAPKTPALIIDRTGNHTVSLYGGTRLPVLEKSAGGYKVQFPDRTMAVINESDAAPVKLVNPLFTDVTPAMIVNTARTFQGVRHLAGGITAQGIDTQGLIYTVYRIHGINLDTGQAALTGRAAKVAKKDLIAGDILVFYGDGLGLYLDNGRFLHAVRKTSVQVGGIFEQRYARSLQYGLRVLGADPEQKKLPSEMTADEIMITQTLAAEAPLGRRIAYWAGRFIGTPYDPDPLGLYVRTNRIVADEKADCMYLTFRAVELAVSTTPGEAIERALDLRFINKGVITDGLVQNYDDRFQYGEDMVWSGKWGRNITSELGAAQTIKGSRGKETVDILPKQVLATRKFQKQLQDGDIIYWVKDPKKRVVEEIVAHLAFIHIKGNRPYLIHASGSKNQWNTANGGMVKEVPFADYVRDMKFIGAFVTRFEDQKLQ